MKEQYFVISENEDGRHITEVKDISSYLDDLVGDEESVEFLDEIPEFGHMNAGYDDGPREIVIIKGKIVVPSKVKVVEKYSIDGDN